MGSCLSTDGSKVTPTPEEKQMEDTVDIPPDDFKGPVTERSCTDVVWLLALALFVIGFFALLGHCMGHGDVYRIINGYDNCANICGMKTEHETDPKFSCKGADMTNRKYLLIKEAGKAIVNPRNVHKECVADCKNFPEYRKLINRCIPKKTTEYVNTFFSKTGLSDWFQEVSEDINLVWPEIIYCGLIALGLALGILFLFRFVAAFIVWAVLLGTVALSIGATAYLWVVWKEKSRRVNNGEVELRTMNTYLAYAIVATIITAIICLVIFAMRKRIQLVVELFEEAGKAVSAMPLLLLEPIWTFISLAVILTLFIYFSIWIESSGYLTAGSPSYYYQKDFAMKLTRWYNLLAMFWMTQFVIGCQHMVIAGAVATWFFTRKKENLSAPISTSFQNLVRYHLGSVTIGSLLIALVELARAIMGYVESILKEPKNELTIYMSRACQCCLYCFEKFLAFWTRNAYIEIAIYGEGFFESGQLAFKMLSTNSLRVATINSVGDFVLFLGKVFVVITTVFIASVLLENKEGLQHMWIPLALIGIFSYFVAHCFITVYEMIIDTIFICFCEDCELNDGITKPYFMSRDLMEYVQHSKKVLRVGDTPPVRTPATELQESPRK